MKYWFHFLPFLFSHFFVVVVLISLQSVLAPLVQLPLFVSFFFGLKAMANLPVESFKTGGYLWFQDLTVFDPYFILPVICSFSMLASVEVSATVASRAKFLFVIDLNSALLH